MKYFIIAGERSGDLHGSNLVKALKDLDKSAEFKGFGGDKMLDAGVELIEHYREMSFMGFLEVITNLGKINSLIKTCKRNISSFKPHAIILIDYGGFNMKIAKYAKRNGFPVHYYITPKVWAWNQKRALKLKRYTDHMYVILPFEKAFFKKYDIDVDYVGNPVLDAIRSHKISSPQVGNYIALLPGSRAQELKGVMPLLKLLVQAFPNVKFKVATVDNLNEALYDDLAEAQNVVLFRGSSYDLLSNAHAAVVTSGTATLETALWEVPQVVIYKTSTISYHIAKRLIKVPYISLVNLVAEQLVVKELIQHELNIDNLMNEVERLQNDREYRQKIKKGYCTIKEKLDEGNASMNVAELILKRLP